MPFVPMRGLPVGASAFWRGSLRWQSQSVRVSRSDEEDAMASGKLFENQISAASPWLLRDYIGIHGDRAMREVWSPVNKLSMVPNPARTVLKNLAQELVKGFPSLSQGTAQKLSSVINAPNLSFQYLEIDLAFVLRDGKTPTSTSEVQRFIQTTGDEVAGPLLSRSGAAFQLTKDWVGPQSPPAQIVGEISISASEAPYKLFQLEKDLWVLEAYLSKLRDPSILPSSKDAFISHAQPFEPLLVLYFNASRKEAMDSAELLWKFLQALPTVCPDAKITKYPLMVVYTPFRNVYTELREIKTEFTEVKTKFDEVKTKVDEMNDKLFILIAVVLLSTVLGLLRH